MVHVDVEAELSPVGDESANFYTPLKNDSKHNQNVV